MTKTLTLNNPSIRITIEIKRPFFKKKKSGPNPEYLMRIQEVEKDLERAKEFCYYGQFIR
jgi:hypothetical protein